MHESNPELKIKIDKGGRVIIPAIYRKMMSIHPGDELIIRLKNDELRLFPQSLALKRLRNTVKVDKNQNYVDGFLSFRKEDSGS